MTKQLKDAQRLVPLILECARNKQHETTLALLEQLAAALAAPQPEQAEPVAKLIGWRTENFLWETSDREKACSWEPNIGVLPIFEGDQNTQLPSAAQPADHK